MSLIEYLLNTSIKDKITICYKNGTYFDNINNIYISLHKLNKILKKTSSNYIFILLKRIFFY